MTVTIDGHLVNAAEKRTLLVGQQAVVILAVQVGPGYHAEARLAYGNDHSRAEAVALAAGRGATVHVDAQGFFPRTDHSSAAIVLSNVTSAWINGAAVYP